LPVGQSGGVELIKNAALQVALSYKRTFGLITSIAKP
jgi:hypothetical protein